MSQQVSPPAPGETDPGETNPTEAGPATANARPAPDAQAIDRILVALDASPHSLRALQAAAQLAALMAAELQGVYVEDINLVRLGGLPFVREVGSYSAALRPLESRTIEREFQLQAMKIRHALVQAAVAANVQWSFQTVRGNVAGEVLQAAESATMVTLGRIGRSAGTRLGSTAQSIILRSNRPVFLLNSAGLVYPLTLLYDSSAAAQRALRLALLLMHEQSTTLRILLPAGMGVPVDATDDEEMPPAAPHSDASHEHGQVIDHLEYVLAAQQIEAQIITLRADEEVPAILATLPPGTLVLPGAHGFLLDKITWSAILVP